MPNSEVEITQRHRPTEYVKAALWGYSALMGFILLALLATQRPKSPGEFFGDLLWDFSAFVFCTLFIGIVVFLLRLAYSIHRGDVIHAGQFGTYVMKPRKTVTLPPLTPDMPAPVQSTQTVTLVQPSEKSGTYLSYARVANMLMDNGIDVEKLAQPEDEPMSLEGPSLRIVGAPEEHVESLTHIQQQVLDSYQRGNRGRGTIAHDLHISEHVASMTLAELRGKGLIRVQSKSDRVD